jgi:hypothetical protein
MDLKKPRETGHQYYNFGDFVKISMPKGICPSVENRIEHWKTNNEETDILVEWAKDIPPLCYNEKGQMTYTYDVCKPVIIAVRSFAEQMRFTDGYYELLSQGGLYAISPGRILCSGRMHPLYLEHVVLRPVINNFLVPKGSLIAHAAAVSINGKIIILMGESSKTSILIELIKRGAAFIADEYLLLNRCGKCNMYSPWMYLEERHFSMFPELMKTVHPNRRERNGVEKRASFNHIADSIKGSNPISRFAISFFRTNFWYRGISCHYTRLFPNSAAVESGPIAYTFHLESNEREVGMEKAEAADIARIEMVAHTIKTGFHKNMADLAGIKHYSFEEINEVLTEALSHSECYRLYVGVREERSRGNIRGIVDNILSLIS